MSIYRNTTNHFSVCSVAGRLSRLLLPLGILVLSACSADNQDLQQWVVDKKAERVAFRNDLPEVKPYVIYEYQSADLRSPFEPTVLESQRKKTSNGLGPDLTRNKQPLESYALDSLRMVGTLLRNNVNFALVQTPDGLIHRVQNGNYMGENDGQIVSISESRIQLSELVSDGLGGYAKRDAAIGLSD